MKSSFHRRMRREKLSPSILRSLNPGFSLIELMAVMAILGILTAIGLVNLTSRLEGERLQNVAKTMAAWLEDRRKQGMTAMEQAGTGVCAVTINPSAATLAASNTTIALPGSSGNLPNICYQENALTLRTLTSNAEDLALNVNPPSISQIRFTFRGTSSNNGTCSPQACPPDAEFKLTLRGQSQARCVKIINPLGQIRLGVARPATGTCSYLSAY